MSLSTLPQTVEEILRSDSERSERLQEALEVVADRFGAVTATIHLAEPGTRVLNSVASKGIPASIAGVTDRIPFGKGIAGLCAQRGEPVTICNLQTDTSGAVRPDARLTGAEGAIAVPILAGDEVVGTLGVGKPVEHAYTDEEQAVLAECTRAISAALD
jgi:L-methionine (R)-S-oxide reductase